ncbi:hypothetical protein M885DRAFT_497 [Pelagophyceae sp. CCMP2097]|nr:hypothetical protein M885DRAFT_497 [Pelagophyceae sp. CCMP2097]
MAATKSLVSCGSSWCATMARCASRRLKNLKAPILGANVFVEKRVESSTTWEGRVSPPAFGRGHCRSAPATTGRLVETRRASPGAPNAETACEAGGWIGRKYHSGKGAPRPGGHKFRPAAASQSRPSRRRTRAPTGGATTPPQTATTPQGGKGPQPRTHHAEQQVAVLALPRQLGKVPPVADVRREEELVRGRDVRLERPSPVDFERRERTVWKADKIAASWSESRASIWETACAATCFSRASASVFRAISALRVSANAEASEGSSAGGTRSQLRATLAMAVNVSAKGSCSFGRKALWMMLSARANLAADSRASAFVASPRRTAKSEASAA